MISLRNGALKLFVYIYLSLPRCFCSILSPAVGIGLTTGIGRTSAITIYNIIYEYKLKTIIPR